MRRKAIAYTPAEMRWLEANRAMIISDYHRAFLAKFKRQDVSAANLHGLRKRNGWKVGRYKGRYKGRRLRYSADEVAWLRDNCTLVIGDCHRKFCAAFGREDVSADQLHSLRKREGLRTGRTGRYEKGNVPANKGKPMPYHPNSAATRFKKGRLPHNTKHEGHERVGTHGYVEISVKEANPHTGFERRYVLKHRWLWEQAHGPIPADMVLKCKGDVLNTDPSNWELVPRGLLPRLNAKSGRHYAAAPGELKPSIMAVAKLEHAVSRRRRDRAQPSSEV